MKYKIKEHMDCYGEVYYCIYSKEYFWQFWKQLPEGIYYNKDLAQYILSKLKAKEIWRK